MSSPVPVLLSDQIAVALAAAGQWTGCDWPTQFGPFRLNLKGLRSSQALIMERATAGAEAEQWHNAVAWLKRVEHDARQAEHEAQQAAHLARKGRLRQALECANRACALETLYHESPIWLPLHDAIAAALRQSEGHAEDE